jgi:hypothetical protein
MNRQLSQSDRAIWRRLVKSYMAFSQSLKDFFSEGTPRVPLIKEAFRRGDIATVLYVARHMKGDELKQILDELVRVSTAPGYAGTVREVILALPREWVLANIEKAVDLVLEDDATENEYRRTLELYRELDENLMLNLAQRALKHVDEDIQEAGRDFLDRATPST